MSKRSYELLPASLQDLQEMRVLEKECFPLDSWPLIELIAALIFPGLVRIKAVCEETMVGFIGGDAKRSQGVGWITTLGVLPAYRREGVANALLDACEKELNVPIIKLSVRKSNLSAQRLYFARGYAQAEVWQGYYEGGEDALILVKENK